MGFIADHISQRSLGVCWPTLVTEAPQLLHVAGSQALLLLQSDYSQLVRISVGNTGGWGAGWYCL